MTATRFKAFVSKYALTSEIYEIDAVDCFNVSPTMVWDENNRLALYHKGEWHRTREEAVTKAEEMRVAKIAALRRSIGKLERKSFV